MKLKGEMVIELTDENTGVVETIREENMVTNAVNHILGLNPMGVFYKASGQYDDQMMWNDTLIPICPNMIGGILLYYPIENVLANYTNTFNVYMRVSGGTGTVDTGWCVASVSGQSMGANAAWDGTITVEDYIERVDISGGLRLKSISENIVFEIDELVQRSYSDVVRGRTALGAFAMPVDVTGSNS